MNNFTVSPFNLNKTLQHFLVKVWKCSQLIESMDSRIKFFLTTLKSEQDSKFIEEKRKISRSTFGVRKISWASEPTFLIRTFALEDHLEDWYNQRIKSMFLHAKSPSFFFWNLLCGFKEVNPQQPNLII